MKSKMYKFNNLPIGKSSYFIIAMFICTTIFAQSPQKMSYQAVIRNSRNALVTSTQIGMQISILQGSAAGTAIYVETQTPSTNVNGLVSLEIGNGTIVTGTFAGIDWAAGPYFVKTETDPKGGMSYSILGNSELMSVPYALHTETAATAKKLAATKKINGVPFDGSADITITAIGMPSFEKELVYDGENSIAITFSLVPSLKIYYNGTLLKQNQWSGIGSKTLKLILDTREKDQLTIIN